MPPGAFGDSSVGVHDLNPKLPASRGGLKSTREAMEWESLSPFMDSSYRLQKLPLKPSSFSLGRCVLSPQCRTLSASASHTGSILTGQLVLLRPGQKGLTGAEGEAQSHTSERWKHGTPLSMPSSELEPQQAVGRVRVLVFQVIFAYPTCLFFWVRLYSTAKILSSLDSARLKAV